jgi:hypothetical protein
MYFSALQYKNVQILSKQFVSDCNCYRSSHSSDHKQRSRIAIFDAFKQVWACVSYTLLKNLIKETISGEYLLSNIELFLNLDLLIQGVGLLTLKSSFHLLSFYKSCMLNSGDSFIFSVVTFLLKIL